MQRQFKLNEGNLKQYIISLNILKKHSRRNWKIDPQTFVNLERPQNSLLNLPMERLQITCLRFDNFPSQIPRKHRLTKGGPIRFKKIVRQSNEQTLSVHHLSLNQNKRVKWRT